MKKVVLELFGKTNPQSGLIWELTLQKTFYVDGEKQFETKEDLPIQPDGSVQYKCFNEDLVMNEMDFYMVGADKGSCPICLEKYLNCHIKSCQHSFHWDCLEKWLEHSNCCPLCRYELPYKTIKVKNAKLKAKLVIPESGTTIDLGEKDNFSSDISNQNIHEVFTNEFNDLASNYLASNQNSIKQCQTQQNQND